MKNQELFPDFVHQVVLQTLRDLLTPQGLRKTPRTYFSRMLSLTKVTP